MRSFQLVGETRRSIFKNLTEDEADAYGLVLCSSGIRYNVSKGEHGWDIYVHDAACEKALNAIGQYLKENQDVHPKQETCWFEYGKNFTGVWVSLILLALYAAIAIGHNSQAFIETYGSDAHHILHGEFYRTVTSLMIHASALHLAGNMAGIALFGTAVCYIMGPGVGWLMILVTGIGGNFMNAFLYQSHHLSIGSSTAIFGAIGILAGYQFLKKFRPPRGRTRAWLPLAGGLALLAFLGGGKYSDVTAHLFGFLAGIVAGILYGFFVKRPPRKPYQVSFLLVALGLIVTSWIKGFGA